jgi:serine/threonine protein kinase
MCQVRDLSLGPEFSRKVGAVVQVAVKCTRPPESTAEAVNCLREIECFASVKHPRVLPFLGACMADPDNCLLVTEFMTGGTLKEWLYGSVPGGRKPWHMLSQRLEKGLHVCPRCLKCAIIRTSTQRLVW